MKVKRDFGGNGNFLGAGKNFSAGRADVCKYYRMNKNDSTGRLADSLFAALSFFCDTAAVGILYLPEYFPL